MACKVSTVKEIVAMFESASEAVTLTLIIPCLPSVGVIVIIDPSRVTAAGVAPLVDFETTRLSVRVHVVKAVVRMEVVPSFRVSIVYSY